MTDSTKIERHPWEVKIDARVFHDAIEITQQGPFDTTREVIRMREIVKQKAVREWLIAEGWIPPSQFAPEPPTGPGPRDPRGFSPGNPPRTTVKKTG